MRRTYFENLDGIRSIAFLMVFISHCWKNLYFKFEDDHWNIILNKFFDIGSLGVNLFFVLSGFLISFLLFEELAQNKKISIKKFYARRILRIWPVYYLVVIVFVFIIPRFIPALQQEYDDIEAVNVMRYLLYMVNFDHINYGINFRWASVLWSVSVEEQFYLFWPIALYYCPKGYFLALFSFLILGSFIFRFLNFESYRMVNYHTLSVIGDLSVGAAGAYIAFYRRGVLDKIFQIKPVYVFLIYLLSIIVLVFRNDIFLHQFTIPFIGLFGSLFFCYIILEQNYNKFSNFKMSNLVMLSSYGKYTYGLYCYHFIAIFIANYARKAFHLDPQHLIIFISLSICSLMLSQTMAYLSYRFMERPLLKMKEKFEYFYCN